MTPRGQLECPEELRGYVQTFWTDADGDPPLVPGSLGGVLVEHIVGYIVGRVTALVLLRARERSPSLLPPLTARRIAAADSHSLSEKMKREKQERGREKECVIPVRNFVHRKRVPKETSHSGAGDYQILWDGNV
uniref:Uncharacterized protein n=1 Tax=Chromera velia CCMP2878 TaxID=1169474 RepID=A0A0G4IBS3_9ALVE|eukprot:Cvel_12877.t1-p1 / transcript=Cvel_12877.t1 / gene=Cvel_12877 / organism=Chromera_velia_CCMP2878 / gene_product=hypothetical protein / transcript_product=hypothetical protein / location=Cvel_scaffold859:54123-57831(-) / protein_length=133 / sequence_SO=supercontig / SO=protein_coding / is_pseudo=false